MLARNKRVPRALFPYILTKGRKYNTEHLLLRIALLPKTAHQSRFSFVVPIKVAKKAVERHMLRRAGYDVIEQEWKNIQNSYVAVFFLGKNAKGITKDVFQHEVRELLKKTPIYTKQIP